MSTYEDFYKSLDAEPDKGTAFEKIFVKWFLKNDPEWSTQVDEVWLWDEYPDRWSPDLGIDLVFRHKNGEIWSVQSKCYDPDLPISKPDIDSFISLSGHSLIDRMLLIGTTDLIGRNANIILNQHNVVTYLKSDFEHSDIEFPENISALHKVKPKEKPTPTGKYAYQQEPIEKVINGFKEQDRGRLIMSCGTGKTYISLWIKEGLSAQRTLVLVPSLGLLSQTLKEWTFASNIPFEVLCVCSDKTVGKRNYDEMIHSVRDLHFPVTSEVPEIRIHEIRTFLKGDENKVIFCTYQSSPIIADAQSDKSIPEFDLVIADEGHRCATLKIDSAFSTVLDDQLIRSKKRLFATATQRIHTSTRKRKSEERGIEISSMDDEDKFGQLMHELTFPDAISRGLLTDYKVVIIGVDDQRISEWIERHELVSVNDKIVTDAQSLASLIGIIKVIKDHNLKRIISFHNRIKNAEDFKFAMEEVLQWITPKNRPEGNLWCEYIEGKMKTSKRNKILSKLKNLGTDQRGIISNARCLSEGVDVPALDGIAFIDPRRSQIDIVQSVGRAIRLSESEDKKYSVIFIPVFIEEGEDPESRIEESNFKPVWDILNALRSHDDALSEELDEYRFYLGREPKRVISSFSDKKIFIDLPQSIDQTFADKLRTILVEKTTESWMFWYGLLKNYVDENKTSRVPYDYITDDKYKLGQWVRSQRSKKNELTDKHFRLLNELPMWSWSVFDDAWEKGYNELVKYYQNNGDLFVHAKYKTNNGYTLGSWVDKQRRNKKNLSVEKVKLLESLKGWIWSVRDYQWEYGFKELKKYENLKGNCLVPFSHETEDGYGLGKWVDKQRQRKGKLPKDRIKRLNSLNGWVWNTREVAWENGYQHLLMFGEENEHYLVPRGFKSKDGYNLSSWVNNQRGKKKTLSKDRIKRLNSLNGWVWNSKEYAWEVAFNYMKEYAKKNGNCLVPVAHETEDGYALGRWVNKQRTSRKTMSKDRKKRLESIKGWVWKVNK